MKHARFVILMPALVGITTVGAWLCESAAVEPSPQSDCGNPVDDSFALPAQIGNPVGYYNILGMHGLKVTDVEVMSAPKAMQDSFDRARRCTAPGGRLALDELAKLQTNIKKQYVDAVKAPDPRRKRDLERIRASLRSGQWCTNTGCVAYPNIQL